MISASLYARRKRANMVLVVASLAATAIGVIWLFVILYELLLNGFGVGLAASHLSKGMSKSKSSFLLPSLSARV